MPDSDCGVGDVGDEGGFCPNSQPPKLSNRMNTTVHTTLRIAPITAAAVASAVGEPDALDFVRATSPRMNPTTGRAKASANATIDSVLDRVSRAGACEEEVMVSSLSS